MVDEQSLLTELSYRIPTGIVDLMDDSHVALMMEILRENNYPEDFILEYSANAKVAWQKIMREAEKTQKKNTGASKEAKQKGLQHIAFSYYGKNGKVLYKSSDDKTKLIPLSKDEKADAQQKLDAKSGSSQKSTGTTTPQQEPEKPSGQSKETSIRKVDTPSGEKDKTLQKVDSFKTPTFSEPALPKGEFEKRNSGMYNGEPPPHLKGLQSLIKNPLFPKKYIETIERLANTKPTGVATKITHFLPKAGAGMIDSQAGELMTMVLTSLPDDEAAKVFDTVYKHAIELQNSKKNGIIKPDWVIAAANNRNAILQRLNKRYPNGKISAAAWDVQDEVEGLGLADYKNNKGKSTDVYFKVVTADGKEVLHEVSLKKDSRINMLNAGGGELLKWDPNIPPQLNQQFYSKEQTKRIVDAAKKFGKQLNALSKVGKTKEGQVFLQTIKDKGFKSFADALKSLSVKPTKDAKKVVFRGMEALAASGNASAKDWVAQHRAYESKFRKDAIMAIAKNSKLKEGALSSISTALPIKSIVSGEEDMAVGNISFDSDTANVLFGTNDFNQIKERLQVVSSAGKDPYIAYIAGKDAQEIPIASLRIREPGVGYEGSFKFALEMLPSFAKNLKLAHEKVYGSTVEQTFK